MDLEWDWEREAVLSTISLYQLGRDKTGGNFLIGEKVIVWLYG